jgi:hypothetical protein
MVGQTTRVRSCRTRDQDCAAARGDCDALPLRIQREVEMPSRRRTPDVRGIP